MISIAICDDQPRELEALQRLLEQYSAEKSVCLRITPYPDGESLLAEMQQNGETYSLLLLDVLMVGLTGIETATRLRQYGDQTPLAFLTTTRDYAVESYEVDAVDYLLKPVEPKRLWHLLDKLLDKPDRPCLPLHIHGTIRYCFYSDILFFESLDHLIYVHLKSGETIRCAETLATLESNLAADARFYRCHKSYLVNMDHIEYVEDVFVLKDGIRVPYRVREKKKITNVYYQYFLKKNLTNQEA